MKSRTYAALFLLVAGCSGATTEDPDNSSGSELERKRLAAEQVASGTSAGDACAQNEWYGDGVCDSFCVEVDTDCVAPDPGGADDPVYCANFVEASDGVCQRPANDPCICQDPDCESCSGPVDPDKPIACAAISEIPDGACKREDDDPCRSQDPDCVDPGNPPDGGYDCDVSNVSCDLAILCVEGTVPTASGSCYGPCVPMDQCADPPPVVCAAYIEESDGVCSRPETDPCRSQDPDCSFGCDAYLEPSDGMCSRPDNDPCRSQDPDCDAACILLIEEPDGVCSRPETDPCRGQDPDCVVACAEYIEEPDGECTRHPYDPCIFQDPDCE